MKQEKVHLYLDEYEQCIMLKALNEFRTKQIEAGLSTDAIDDVFLKTVYAPTKKLRVVERDSDESR